MKKIVAIVQARMGSSRLPGKVMMPLLGKPAIALLFERLQRSTLIQHMVLATSTNQENDELCQFVESINIDVYRGSEEDVLSRFAEAAKQTMATDIVRITGDSPLLDANICDQLINYYQEKNADYAYLSAHFAEGVDCEVISAKTLELANNQANKGSEREHVTLFAYNNADKFNVVEMPNTSDDSQFRFTVDNAEDFEVVTSICNYFSDKITITDTNSIKEYLSTHPEVMKINHHILRNEGLQKSLEQDKLASTHNG